MKKLLNYSLLMLLFSFIAFACSKEDGEVGPSASLMKASTVGNLDGYEPGCLRYSEGRISLQLIGIDQTATRNKGRGLSHLILELIDCYGNSLESEGNISDARIEIGGKTYYEGPDKDFILEYSDGSCTPNLTNFVKFEILNEKLNQALRIGTSTFSFTWSGTSEIGGANIIIKTGNGCFRAPVTCVPDCKTPNEGDCTRTQGYWKTHGSGDCKKGNNTNAWPDGFNLTIDGETYYADDLCALFNEPVRGTNLGLVHQLIAAELNIQKLNAPAPSCLQAAYDWLNNPASGGIYGTVKDSDLIKCLTDFNESTICPTN